MLNFAAMRGRQLGKLKRRVRDTAVRGALAAIGLVFVGLAMVFVLVAAHTWVSARLGTIGSAVVLAAALLIIGLVFLLLASRPMREEPLDASPAEAGLNVGLGDSPLVQTSSSAASPLQNPMVQAAGMGLIAGILLGRRRPRRRRRSK